MRSFGGKIWYNGTSLPFGAALTSQRAGYILLELLICVAIIVLIAAMVVSPLAKWLDAIRLQQGARELTATLRSLHNKSLVEERRFQIIFIGNDNVGWGYDIKRADDDGILRQEYRQWLPPGIKLTHFSFPNLIFHPTGAPSAGITIKLANIAGHSIRITVLPATGRVKMFEEKEN